MQALSLATTWKCAACGKTSSNKDEICTPAPAYKGTK